jgi:hypothetical protein
VWGEARSEEWTRRASIILRRTWKEVKEADEVKEGNEVKERKLLVG